MGADVSQPNAQRMQIGTEVNPKGRARQNITVRRRDDAGDAL
jgi:hypothetical protein